MRHIRIRLSGLAASAGLALILASGCENGPPGGGVTNGSAPNLTADKQSMRTDMPGRARTDQGEMKGAGGTSVSPGTDVGSANVTGSATTGSTTSSPGTANAGGGTNAGSGGKGPGNGGGTPAVDPAPRGGADRKDTVQAVGSAGAQPPPTGEGTAPGSAAGATKPAGNIKVGTPNGPN